MIPSYLSEEMHLRDLHSAHQELCNHGKKKHQWATSQAWKFSITSPSPLPHLKKS